MGSVCDGHGAVVAALAVTAAGDGLVIFAGAGISVPLPTDLPGGDKAARRAFDALAGQLAHAPECDPDSLTSLADAMEELPGGSDLLRKALLATANYLGAEPNDAHGAMAALFMEGAAKVVTTNWDDCIERAAHPERIQVIVSDEDQLTVSPPALFKVHGCASRPDSLKASRSELKDPNPWARSEVHGLLGGPTVIFVGIGHVADYMRDRINEIVKGVQDTSHLRVVSPSIQSKWEETGWAELVPSLAHEHRIEMTADAFMTELLDAYCGLGIDATEALLDEGSSNWKSVREQLCKFTGVELIRWLRERSYDLSPGGPSLHSDNGKRALLSLAFLPGDGSLELSDKRIALGGRRFELVIARSVRPAREFRREAERRAVSLRSQGKELPDAFICSGTAGRLSRSLGNDVVGGSASDDVVGGPTSAEVELIDADALIKGTVDA